jgi:uncharacterized protein
MQSATTRTEPTDQSVTFSSGHVTLAGTLLTPAHTVGAALLIPGSGEVDRDSDHKKLPLSVTRHLADALAERGIASLRYDKRGVGASSGSFLETGFHDNTDDAEAALAELARLVPDVPLFVIGHSEGAMHATVLAARHPELAGAVMLAAPGTTGEETMFWQGVQISESMPPFTKRLLKLLRLEIPKLQRKALAKIKATTTDVARIQLQKVNAKWQREFIAYDPREDLPRISVPVLAITGGKDLQVNPDDLEIIRDTVPGPIETHRPADLTHLLRDDHGKPSLSAYKRLAKLPTDEALLRTVGDWIAQRADRR